MTVEVRLLGPVTLLVDGVDATPGAARERSLLASLLIRRGRVVPVETIAADLWGRQPPASARAQVQTQVSRLRKRLGASASFIERRPPGYAAHLAADALDLSRFESWVAQARTDFDQGRIQHASDLLHKALGLWQGPALAGTPEGTGLVEHAARLEESRLDALSLRLDADLRLGMVSRAVPELRMLCREHPLHEGFHVQLITALLRSGRGTEALKVHEQWRSALTGAFGERLPAGVEELRAAILRGDVPAERQPELTAAVTAALTPVPESAPAPGTGSATAAARTIAPADALRFSVLGPVRVRRGDESLGAGSPQQRAVLAALLLRAGHMVTTGELLHAVWGEEPPARAVAALRTYAFRLRKVLGPDVLEAHAGGYRLRVASGCLDLQVCEQLAADAEKARAAGDLPGAREKLRGALGLWDGEPLAGVPGPYAETQRSRLAEWRLALLEQRLELDLELGGHAEAVSELTALSAEHPLRERLRGLLMLALYRSGRQAEALGVYADTWRLLNEELGVIPGPELAHLHRRVLEADPSLLAARAGGDGVPSLRPAQLPATVADFTGREALVHELAGQLASGESRVIAVSGVAGISGVGKTTLAVHIAHAALEHFPDGQLYVDLRGSGPDPAEPEAVLAAFLRALGTPASAIPDGLEERAALYRSALAGRRVLALLDNARDAAQVRPLLPGSPGCAVLLTSRTRMLDLAGAHLVDLDVMSPEEALALFSRIVGEDRVSGEREAALEVVAACGFLPLAIRIAASRLATRRTWTVSLLARELADERRRLDELRVGDLAVTATFELGYRQLEAAQARAFRLLAYAQAPVVSVSASAALLDEDESTTEGILDSLVDTGLLESPAPGHYRFHTLVEEYARVRAEDDDSPARREAALRRLLDHCLATAVEVHRLGSPGDCFLERLARPERPGPRFPDGRAALDRLLEEGPLVLSTVRRAVSRPGLLDRAADVLLATGELAESDALADRYEDVAWAVASACLTHKRVRAEARARIALGRVRHFAGRADAAEPQFRRAALLGRITQDPLSRGLALALRGAVEEDRGRHAEAVRHFTGAADVFRADGDRHGEADALAGLARAHASSGRSEEAVTLAGSALSAFAELGATGRLAHGHDALGTALHMAGRHEESRAHFHRALNLFERNRRPFWAALTHHRVARLELDAGRPGEAAAHAEQALVVLRDIGGDRRRAEVLRTLGDALLRIGHPGRARDCLREAMTLFEGLGTTDTQSSHMLLRALAAHAPAPGPAQPLRP